MGARHDYSPIFAEDVATQQRVGRRVREPPADGRGRMARGESSEEARKSVQDLRSFLVSRLSAELLASSHGVPLMFCTVEGQPDYCVWQ